MIRYDFKREDAEYFAKHIGAVVRIKGDEMHFNTCPYCKSRKDKGTFSINLITGQFKCLRDSCGQTGNMITLAKDFDFSLGNEIDEYYAPKKSYRKLKTPKEKIVPKASAIKFLEERGISKSIAEKYEITTQTDRDNVLVFPFFDENGELQFVKYRKTDFNKETDNAKEWCEKNTKPILFGMKQCSKDFNRLVITEGQMDSLAVATAFDGDIDVVSVPTGSKGTTWIPYCFDWVSKYKEIVVFGDFEKGKISLLEDIHKRFKSLIKHVKHDMYKDCKDANELLLKYGAKHVVECVESAEELPIKQVVDVTEVVKKDLFKIPKLKTGISDLDKLLYGGLPFGFYHILGGKRGDGKSTFGSQILAEAIEQGYKCFSYSGEMDNGTFKSWLYFQIAGKRNIVENTNQDGTPYWYVPNSKNEQIDSWIRGKLKMYDNSVIDDELVDLPNLIEDVIMRYGIQVILLDNLMTAVEMNSDSKDEFVAQKQFCGRLRKIALKYDVLILLVAHRRKNGGTTDANDEISGSAYITNACGIMMSYDRDKELPNQFDRKLIVAKNRVFGRLNYDGITLHFEEKSKRIYGDVDDVQRPYGWECKLDGFYGSDETPFE